jgi:hypothetical protein
MESNQSLRGARTARLLVATLLLAFLGSCGGGGGGGSAPPPAAPSAPTGVSAAPGNGQAALTWAAVSGATSYNVYTSSTSPATTASTRTTVSGTSTTLASLTNGNPVFAAVTAVNAGGESALSSEVCAIPTPASTTGLTLYDPLCGSALNGSKWLAPALITRGVSNGAMLLSTRASNMERHDSRGLVYATTAAVSTSGGDRVTTLQANVTVPASTASRSGDAEIRAVLRLAYQPPATRLDFPAGNLDALTIQVGLQDTGSGLTAIRRVTHCDNANCITDSTTGITFTDPAGFTGTAPAAYDTTYTVNISLNETSGEFSWSIVGGALNLAGTANPSAYLLATPNWVALGSTLAGSGFQSAQLRTRVRDFTGGSAATIGAQFDNVMVGKNNNPAVLWDDFSGAGGNSGPVELRADKWTAGELSITMPGGGLVERSRITSRSNTNALNHVQGLLFSDPSAINTIQADVTVNACSNSLGSTNRVELVSSLYNDGTPGTTPPDTNQPNSSVGDVQAHLFVDCVDGTARFQFLRWTSQSQTSLLTGLGNNIVPMGSAGITGNLRTMRMRWDPVARQVTFQVDGATPVVIDPTVAAPFVKAANSPFRAIGEVLTLPATGASDGATASMEYKVNNVFTAP